MAYSPTDYGWVLIELVNGVHLPGRATPTTVASAPMLRLEIPETETTPAQVQFIAGAAIGRMSTITEEAAREVASVLGTRLTPTVWVAPEDIAARLVPKDAPSAEDGPTSSAPGDDAPAWDRF